MSKTLKQTSQSASIRGLGLLLWLSWVGGGGGRLPFVYK
jgi:hypothetical protein